MQWLLPVEVLLFIAVFVADDFGLIPLTKTPLLLLIAWASLRLRGLRWRDVGLTRPDSWPHALAIGVAAGLGMELLALFVTEPMIARVVGADPGLEEFKPVVGDLQLMLIFIGLSWVLAAFGEEMVYRGYLMPRVAGMRGPSRPDPERATASGPWVVALIVMTLVFGYAHAPGQGLAGALQEGLSGFWLGLLYLASQRTLAVPIIAHGVANTLAFVLIYLGRYPGV